MKKIFNRMLGSALAALVLVLAIIAIGGACRAVVWAFNVGWKGF